MKLAMIAALLFLSPFTIANEKSLCGADDRQFSYDEKIGRVFKDLASKMGCTATMIGKDCALTAGHCVEILNFVEFNVPHPDRGSDMSRSAAEDIYRVDRNSIKYSDGGFGKDWAVFKLKPNVKTGQYAGDVYGTYPVSFKKPRRRSQLRITGFGSVRGDRWRSGLQQTATGKMKGSSMIFRGLFKYAVDTEPGNSGSVVLTEGSNEVIGIHTNGGCNSGGGENHGTLINKNKELINAIKACLAK